MRRLVLLLVTALGAAPAAGAGDDLPAAAPAASPTRPPPPWATRATPAEGADALRAARVAKDTGAFAAWAALHSPDPWRVADELCARGEHDLALALAAAGPGRGLERLPEYIASRRGKLDDAATRAAIQAAEPVRLAQRWHEVLAACADMHPPDDGLLPILFAQLRGQALSNLRRSEEALADLRRAERASEALGWRGGVAIALLLEALDASVRHDLKSALTLTERAIAIDESRQARAGVSFGHLIAGQGYVAVGNLSEATARVGQALKIEEELGDRKKASTLRLLMAMLNAETKHPKAIEALAELLARFEKEGDRPNAALTLIHLGSAYSGRGDEEAAKAAFDRALAIYAELKDPAGEGATCEAIAYWPAIRLHSAAAIEPLTRALACYRAAADPTGVARVLMERGALRLARGDRAQGQSDLEAALAEPGALLDLEDTARLRANLGALVLDHGDLAGAEPLLLTALETFHTLGDDLTATTVLGNLGTISLLQGDYATARARHERALQSFEAAGREGDRVMSLSSLGLIHQAAGDYSRASELFQQAEALAQRKGLDRELGQVLANAGSLALHLGEFGQALTTMARGRALLEQAKDWASAARTRSNEAQARFGLGEYARALDEIEAAHRLAQETQDRGAEALSLAMLGGFHAALGDLGRAEAELRAALEMLRATGNRPNVAIVTANLTALALSAGDVERAGKAVEVALTEVEPQRDTAGTAHLWILKGAVEEARSDLPAAAEAYRRAIALRRSLKGSPALGLLNLGGVERRLGDLPRAAASLTEALALSDAAATQPVAAGALWGLADVALDRGQPRAALEQAHAALTAMGRVVRGLSEESGARARERYAELFGTGVRAAEALKDVREASFWLESGRAGALLESLGGRVALREALVPKPLRDEETAAHSAEAHAQLARTDARARKDAAGVRVADAELARAQTALEAVVARIQREAKRAAGVLYPTPAALEALQADLAPDDALVVYGLFEAQAYALVSRAAGSRLVRLGEPQAIRAAAERFAALDAHTDVEALVAPLRALVVEPLGLEPGVKRVLVSPDGPLAYVPFGLLLGERDVVYAPSGTTLKVLREDAGLRGEGVLALGDPDYGTPASAAALALRGPGRTLTPLPGTRAEAQAVGDVVLLGREASVPGLRSALAQRPRWRAVHLACHGLLDSERPSLSALALTPTADEDGFLSALDVFRTPVPADLVVLSACETGRGRIVKVEGVEGLTRAFMYAGAPRVLVSLWRVDDEATRLLMERFYALWNPREAATKPLSIAAALRAAQAAVRDHTVAGAQPFAHPYFWAAWSLWGLPD